MFHVLFCSRRRNEVQKQTHFKLQIKQLRKRCTLNHQNATPTKLFFTIIKGAQAVFAMVALDATHATPTETYYA